MDRRRPALFATVPLIALRAWPDITVQPGFSNSGWRHFKSWLGPRPGLQLVVTALIAAGIFYLLHNLVGNMAKVGLTPGFGFLWQPANFAIGESFITYEPQDSYGRAILVGVLNTLMVSFIGCIAATVLGIALGIMRLSANRVLSGFVRAYVEVIRNSPLLLQLFFWSAMAKAFPPIRNALEPLPGMLLSNRGFNFPSLSFTNSTAAFSALVLSVAVVLGWIAASITLRGNPRKKFQAHGALVILTALFALAIFFFGGLVSSWPERHGFNVIGGASWSPEFAALTVGLIINAAAGIAETVRGAIQSVPSGQWEAGRAMGLSPAQNMRLVILPQALRVAIPILISSYLSLTKNSSLAVAIGYPELVSIVNTTANQSGHAFEAILVMMVVYLSISFVVSLVLNIYHRRTAIVSR